MGAKKVISEDMSLMQNKWTSDPARREMKPTVVTLFDLVKAHNALKNGNTKAPKVMPWPTHFLVQELGELYMKTINISGMIKQASNNPLIRDREEGIAAVKKTSIKLRLVRKLIKQIAMVLNNIVVEK